MNAASDETRPTKHGVVGDWPQNGILYLLLPTSTPCCWKGPNYDLLTFTLALLAAALLPSPAVAGGPGDAGVKTCSKTRPDASAESRRFAVPQYVEKIVCEPQWVTEKRTITCTQYASAKCREKVVTVYRSVPETHQVTRQYTVMVPEQRTRTVAYTAYRPVYDVVERQYQVCVPVYSNVEQQYTVQVPVYRTEERTYTVKVPHQEMRSRRPPGLQGRSGTQEMRTVTCDEGHWDTCVEEVPCGGSCCRRRCCLSKCGSCGGCCGTRTVCRKVWVPNVVTKQVPVTVCRTVMEEQPYEYCVTVCKPETRTCQVRVCDYKTEVRTSHGPRLQLHV